jgi:sulfate-transporting ATPase
MTSGLPLAAEFISQATLRFVILGTATGALYALVSLGIVLTYRASGVLNFAAGALGAIAAFLFYSLRDDHGVPWVLALVLALLAGAAIGALTHLIVMVALRRVSLLGKLIATLGLMTMAPGLITVLWGSSGVSQPDSILPTTGVHISSDIIVPLERLIVIGIVIVAAIALRFVYSATRFGLATSAVAESRRVAASSGWSPTAIELANFVLAGVLSAAAAILLAPIIGLSGSVLTLTVLPALAAALVGRFSSFAVTVAAALVIGIVGAELSLFKDDIANALGWDSTSLGGLPDAVPLLIIIIATVMGGRSRLERGETLARLPLPGSGRIAPVRLLIAGAVGLVLVLTADATWATALTITFATAILVLSVVVVTGYAGQLSLCQFALAGFGAWVAARLVATQGWSFELGLLAGILAAVPLGLLVAVPALRTRGVNLAIVTLGLALMISAVIFNNGSLTGGYVGTQVTPPKFFGLDIDPILHPERYGAFVLVALLLAGLIVANLRRGRAGRRLLAVRTNERAAASLGVGVFRAKLFAFGLSAGIAGLSGVLFAFRQPNVQFVDFDVFGSINAVLFAVVGGVGWASGAIVGAIQAPGAVGAQVLDSLFGSSPNITSWLLVISGVSVIAVLVQAPDGLAALASQQLRPLTDRVPWRRSAGSAAAPTPRRGVQPAMLEVSGVTVRFGGVVALDDVSFSVRPGEIVGLIGPNGAGKTTMIDVITGFTRPTAGSVSLDGASLEGSSPERRARSGIGRSWQSVELFEEMTIRENLLVAADDQSFGRYLTDLVRPGRMPTTQVMDEVVSEFELSEYLDDRPSKLSQGASRLVGIGRVLITEPKIVLLDEPAAGLDSRESEDLGVAIRGLVERSGVGVLIVEHDVQLLLNICDRIVVLDFGRKIAEGTPTEVARDPQVVRAYLGASHEAAPEVLPIAPGPPPRQLSGAEGSS